MLDTKSVRFYLELLLVAVICENPQENYSLAEPSFPHTFSKSITAGVCAIPL